jgi:hypothetical protein
VIYGLSGIVLIALAVVVNNAAVVDMVVVLGMNHIIKKRRSLFSLVQIVFDTCLISLFTMSSLSSHQSSSTHTSLGAECLR